MGHNSTILRYTFKKHERLTRSEDFRRVIKHGVRIPSPHLIVWNYTGNGLEFNRLGIIASRRCGGAVQRNRFKRMVREIFRTTKHDMFPGHDLIVMARHDKQLATGYQLFKNELLQVWTKLGLLKQ